MIPGSITITNRADHAEIDIEGVIGIPEDWQFDEPQERVSTYEKFKTIVNRIRDLKSSRIIVNIRSLGGNVGDALLIFDTLTGLSAEITTRCYGYVASAATIIAQAASLGKREVSENSLYLIHRAASYSCGNSNDLSATLQMLQKTDDRLSGIYASRSGRDAEEYMNLMDRNNGQGEWLSPQETLSAGLADRIIPTGSVTSISPANVRALGLPPIPQDKIPATDTVNNTLKIKNMKVKNTWNAILAYFGFDREKDNELTEAQVEKLNDELEARQKEVANLSARIARMETEAEKSKNDLNDRQGEITRLTDRVKELEAENAKMKAGPTETEPKEDPALDGTGKNPRRQSYDEDVKNFKSK